MTLMSRKLHMEFCDIESKKTLKTLQQGNPGLRAMYIQQLFPPANHISVQAIVEQYVGQRQFVSSDVYASAEVGIKVLMKK